MKTTNLILILVAVMSLMSCGQLHVVTLYVDTDKIAQNSHKTVQDNLKDYVRFGQPTGVSNEKFTTHVRRGDKIIWEAVSIDDPKVQVQIDSIYHLLGDKIFKSKSSGGTIPWLTTNPSLAETQGIARVLFKGTIKKRPREQKAFLWEKYGLVFTVNEITFEIDPVMKAYR